MGPPDWADRRCAGDSEPLPCNPEVLRIHPRVSHSETKCACHAPAIRVTLVPAALGRANQLTDRLSKFEREFSPLAAEPETADLAIATAVQEGVGEEPPVEQPVAEVPAVEQSVTDEEELPTEEPTTDTSVRCPHTARSVTC